MASRSLTSVVERRGKRLVDGPWMMFRSHVNHVTVCLLEGRLPSLKIEGGVPPQSRHHTYWGKGG